MKRVKMKKQNMDHIRERFEQETGVTLPEKSSWEIPSRAGHFAAAAAGLLCLVFLGQAWYKVSLDKQQAAETASSGYVLSNGGAAPDATGTEESSTPEDTADGSTETVTEDSLTIQSSDSSTVVSLTSEAEDAGIGADERVVETAIFTEGSDWVWPVPNIECDNVLVCVTPPDGINPERPYPYYSIPGTEGDDVVAMHDCTITDSGFDPQKGNFVAMEVNGNTIEYHHLNTVCVSAGDEVTAGTKIGTLGNTGASTGPHLGITATAADGTSLIVLSVPTVLSEEEVITE